MTRQLLQGRVRKSGALAALCVVLVLLLYGVAGGRVASYMRGGEVRLDAAQAHWKEEISSRGARASTDEFLQEAAALSSREAHLLAHAFGGALYDAEGSSGFSQCPDAFFWGCAHQFIGEAIQQEGLAVIPKLFSTCEEGKPSKKFACMHAIGHGLVGYFGYDEQSLNEALSQCYSYSTSSYGGCLAGAFMEYNLRFLSLTGPGNTLDAREVDQGNPYGPCAASVDARFRAVCAFELPRWWYHAADTVDIEGTAGDLAGRCSGAPAELRRSCFEGLGALVAVSTNVGGSPERAIAMCSGLGGVSLERLYCTTGIVLHMHYWNMPGYKNVCEKSGLTGSYLRYCKDFAATEVTDLGPQSPPSP